MLRRHVFAASALIASAFAVSAPAQAANTFSGTSNFAAITDGNGAFGDAGIPNGTFTDIIQFTIPTAGTQDVDLTFLFRSGLTNLVATLNGTPIPLEQKNVSFSGSLSTSVMAGLQEIRITGNSAGNGSYTGNVAFSAVPELATWLMMIAGVGFTGAALRRRQTAYKVNYAF